MRLALSTRGVAGLLLAIGLAAPAAAPAAYRRGPAARLTLFPAVVRLQRPERVEVSRLPVASLQVVPLGALEPGGRAFGWRSFRLVHGTWVVTLPAPLLRGVYPLVLRTRAGARVFRSGTWFMRVLAPGTLSRPSFSEPSDVVRWWVRGVAHGTLVAFKRWSLPGWDLRDPRLHRLFVVAYDPPGPGDPGDRRGLFLTAFRNRYGVPWRFLEAKLTPEAASRGSSARAGRSPRGREVRYLIR
jgi:hypothetical protein